MFLYSRIYIFKTMTLIVITSAKPIDPSLSFTDRFGDCTSTIYMLYTGWDKKVGHRLVTIILSNLNRLIKIHWKIPG